MAFNPTGIGALALQPGLIDNQGAFVFFQTNTSGYLDLFLSAWNQTPQLIYSSIPVPANFNVALMTGAYQSFVFESGRVTFQSEEFQSGFGVNLKESGQVNVGWYGGDTAAGLATHSYLSNGAPEIRLRSENEDGFYGEYGLFFGDKIKLNDNYGNIQSFTLPGKMAAFVGNSYTNSTWKTGIIGASSWTAPTANHIIGTAFCSWDSLGTLYRDFGVFPGYCEIGGGLATEPPQDLGGRGAFVLNTTPSPPSQGVLNGVTMFSSSFEPVPNLSFVDNSGNTAQIYPSIKNTAGLSYSSEVYTNLTSTRSLTDDDNGKKLYFTGNYVLTVPNSLLKPFSATLISEGTGLTRITGGGGCVVRNASGRYRTGGQYSVCNIDYRTGTNAILYGDTKV